MRAAYATFVSAFRETAEKLKAGDRSGHTSLGLVPASHAVRERVPGNATVLEKRCPPR